MSRLKKEYTRIFRSDDQVFNFIENEALDGLALREIEGTNDFWADQRFWQHLGFKNSQVKDGLSFWQSRLKKEDFEHEQGCFSRFLEDPENNTYEPLLRFYTREGATIYMQLKSRLLDLEAGSGKKIIIAFREVSDLMRQEAFLKHSSEIARIGFYDWNIRAKELHWSKVAKEIHAVPEDYKPEYRKAIKFYKSGRSQQKITELIDRALHYGEFFDEELEIVDAENKEKWVRVIGIPELIDGRAIRLYGLFQDIDLQIRTQNAIRSERSLYRQVLEGAKLGAWDWDIDSDNMTLNRKAAAMLGYDLEVMRREGRLYWFDLIHPDDKKRVLNDIQNYLVGRNPEFEVECRLQKANGQYRWLSITAKLFQPDLHFDRPRLVGVWKDIHRDKQKMDFYGTFIQEAPLAIAMFDRDMRYINCSNKWRSDYGLEEEALIGQSHYEIFPEISREWRSLHQACLRGETIQRDEDLFARSDGRKQWIRWEIRPWYDENREIGGIIMYTEDISLRKNAERELAQVEKAFQANFTNSAIGMAIVGRDGKWLDVNKRLCEILGYSRDELKQSTFQKLTHPDDLAKDLNQLDKLNKGQISNYQIQKRYLHKNGQVVSAILGATAVRDEQDEVAYFISQIIEL